LFADFGNKVEQKQKDVIIDFSFLSTVLTGLFGLKASLMGL